MLTSPAEPIELRRAFREVFVSSRRSVPSSSLPEPSKNSSLLGFQPRVAPFAWRTSPNATTGVEPGTTRLPDGGHCLIRAEIYSGISIGGMGSSNCGTDGSCEATKRSEQNTDVAVSPCAAARASCFFWSAQRFFLACHVGTRTFTSGHRAISRDVQADTNCLSSALPRPSGHRRVAGSIRNGTAASGICVQPSVQVRASN